MTETKIKSKPCTPELLAAVEESLMLIDDTYNEIGSDEMYQADNHTELKVAIDRFQRDQITLVDLINKQLSDTVHDDVEVQSNKSSVKSKSVSIRSSHKSGSSTASSARLRAAAADAEAKKLDLEAELRRQQIDEEVEELEQELQRQKNRANQQKIRAQLEAENKKVQVYQTAAAEEDEGMSVLMSRPSITSHQQIIGLQSSSFNPLATPPPAPENTPTAPSDLHMLVQSLTNSITLLRLPPPEPIVFNGDPLVYTDWANSFSALIENKGCNDAQKLHYLKRYISGPAREVISGFFLYDRSDSFKEAKKILDERYGDPFVIARAFRARLEKWPKVPNKDSIQMRKLSDTVHQCLSAMKCIPQLAILNDDQEINKIVAKLPEYMENKWTRKVVTSKRERERYPTFKEFSNYLSDEAEVMSESQRIHEAFKTTTAGATADVKPGRRYNATQVRTSICLFCKRDNHTTADCFTLARKPLQQRRQFMLDNKLWFACVTLGHMAQERQKKAICRTCQKEHPTCSHPPKTDWASNQPSPSESKKESPAADKPEILIEQANCNKTHSNSNGLTSMIVPVWLSDEDCTTEQLVYALLDTHSDITFALDNVANKTNALNEKTSLLLSTMASEAAELRCNKYTGLVIRGFDSEEKIKMPRAYGRSTIPVNRNHIPSKESAEPWPHLTPIGNELPDIQDCEIGMLIG